MKAIRNILFCIASFMLLYPVNSFGVIVKRGPTPAEKRAAEQRKKIKETLQKALVTIRKNRAKQNEQQKALQNLQKELQQMINRYNMLHKKYKALKAQLRNSPQSS